MHTTQHSILYRLYGSICLSIVRPPVGGKKHRSNSVLPSFLETAPRLHGFHHNRSCNIVFDDLRRRVMRVTCVLYVFVQMIAIIYSFQAIINTFINI